MSRAAILLAKFPVVVLAWATHSQGALLEHHFARAVIPAVVVRQRKPWRRKDGVFIYFEDNAGVIVNPKGEMKGIHHCHHHLCTASCIQHGCRHCLTEYGLQDAAAMRLPLPHGASLIIGVQREVCTGSSCWHARHAADLACIMECMHGVVILALTTAHVPPTPSLLQDQLA